MESAIIILKECEKCGVKYAPTRSVRCPHRILKRFIVKGIKMGLNTVFYARAGGRHIHSSKECPMLVDEQFEHYGYKEIDLEEAQRLKLSVCPCVHKIFGSHHRLTITAVKRLVRR